MPEPFDPVTKLVSVSVKSSSTFTPLIEPKQVGLRDTQTSRGVSKAVSVRSGWTSMHSGLVPGSLLLSEPVAPTGMYCFNLKSIVNPTSSSECLHAKLLTAGQYHR